MEPMEHCTIVEGSFFDQLEVLFKVTINNNEDTDFTQFNNFTLLNLGWPCPLRRWSYGYVDGLTEMKVLVTTTFNKK
jgi:hypothetical protein